MVCKPSKTLGLIVGLAIALTVVGVDVFLIQRMLRQGFGLDLYFTGLLFMSTLPLLALLAYWYHGLVALRYYLDRNALVIACGAFSHVVPLDCVLGGVPGSQVVVSRGFRGIGWPGYLRGYMRLRGLGALEVHSSQPLERQLVVVTRSRCYGISPPDAEQFSRALEVRRALGATRTMAQAVEYAPLATLPVWRDWWFWVPIALALVANVGLFGFVAGVYGRLPGRVLLRLDPSGEIARVVPKASLLLVSGIGTLTLGVNSVLGFLLHRRERLGAYLLVGVGLAIQPILWQAVLAIVGR